MNSITSRIDAITNIPVSHRAAVPPCPRSVKIELTARCNFACAFCARSLRLRDQKDMDRDLFRRLLREMRDEGVEEIGLFYLGESFLCKWLPEAVWYAKHDCEFPYVFLTTNGSLATPTRVEACMRNGLDSLKFSFNYADKAQFEEIARVKGSLFDEMIRNVKASREVRDRVERDTSHHCGLFASYIQYDGEQAQRMEAAVAEIIPYVDEVYALPLYSQAEYVGASERERGWSVTAGNRGRIGALRDPIPCWAAFTEGHITYDGKLSACCFDHDGRFHMGDLTKQGFREAWQGKRFVELRKAHLAHNLTGTPCEKCVAYA